MSELHPTILVPRGREAIEAKIGREFHIYVGARAVSERSDQLDAHANRRRDQAEVNLNFLLDRYPYGVPRADHKLIEQGVAA